jgi:tripartite-type tricarboxylate transporter receptor subunit TctC
LISDNKVKAVVILAEKRMNDYKDVPSSYELGYKVKISTTRGYAVLASTPDAIKKELSAKLYKAMQHDVFASYLKGSSLDPKTSPAPMEVWDKQLKENFANAKTSLSELGLLK